MSFFLAAIPALELDIRMRSSFASTPSLSRKPHAERGISPEAVDHHLAYLPTTEQIIAECKLIREGWSRVDQHRRRVGATAIEYSEH
jgi:hypothetical protein